MLMKRAKSTYDFIYSINNATYLILHFFHYLVISDSPYLYINIILLYISLYFKFSINRFIWMESNSSHALLEHVHTQNVNRKKKNLKHQIKTQLFVKESKFFRWLHFFEQHIVQYLERMKQMKIQRRDLQTNLARERLPFTFGKIGL